MGLLAFEHIIFNNRSSLTAFV